MKKIIYENYEIELLDSGFSAVRSLEKRIKKKNGRTAFYSKRRISDVLKISAGSRKSKYVYVNIRVNGKHKSISKAKLIAENFIENPNGFKSVGFKDGNTMNTHIDNLFWQKEDSRYKHRERNVQTYDLRCITERETKIPKLGISDTGHKTYFDTIKYDVKINFNNKQYYVGTFNDLETAQHTRDWFEEAVKDGFSYDMSDFEPNTFFHDDLKKFFTNNK